MKVITKTNKFERKLPALAIVFNDKKQVLMVQRNEVGKKWHTKWAFPGGGIEFGENPKKTAIRETKEETGININIITDYPIVINYSIPDINEDIISIVYPAKYTNGEIDTSLDDSTLDARWFEIESINLEDCLPLTRELIIEAEKFLN